jgi:hypothetical protein
MLERCAGLVFGFLFQNGRASRVNDESHAANQDLGHDWIWLHLSLADHRAKRFIESFELLPPPARQVMLVPRHERIQFHLTPTGAYGVLPISSATSPTIRWGRGGWPSGSMPVTW